MRLAAAVALLAAAVRAAPVYPHGRRLEEQRAVHEQAVHEQAQSTCIAADNYLNAQYTVKLQVGTPKQELHVVPDTGSFEVVLSSKECTGCGGHRKFDREASTTFTPKVPKETVTTSYGQGNVKSEAVYDEVTVGGLTVPKQSILLMQNNELRDYGAAAYDGVMGLGIPAIARKQDPADLAVQTSLNISTVAICFGQFDQEPGRIDFGPRPNHAGLNFQNVEVVGSSHWAVDVKSIGLTTQPNSTMMLANGKTVFREQPQKLAVPGCEDKCTGIIDSGTSLIAMPTTMLNSLLNQIGDVAADCSNVHSLPTLTMTLGGVEFELPPQMYVAKMEVEKTVATSHAASVLGATSLGGLHSMPVPSEHDPLSSFRRRIHAAVSLGAQPQMGGGGGGGGAGGPGSRLPAAITLGAHRRGRAHANSSSSSSSFLSGDADDEDEDEVGGGSGLGGSGGSGRSSSSSSSSSSRGSSPADERVSSSSVPSSGGAGAGAGGGGVSAASGGSVDDASKPETSVACVPLFMEMDMSTDLPGTPLILGIPFLRAYMARFDRTKRTIGLAKVPVGSEYCASCDAPAAMMLEAASESLASAGPGSTGATHRPAPTDGSSSSSSEDAEDEQRRRRRQQAEQRSNLQKQTHTQLNALIPKTDDILVMGGAIDPPHPESPRPYRWANKAIALHVNNLRVSQWARDAHYRQWHAYKQSQMAAELQEAQLHRIELNRAEARERDH